MAVGGVNIGQELLNVPMGEMVRSMAMAIADAQWALDRSSIRVAEMMSGQQILRDLDTGKLIDANGRPTNTPTIIDTRVFFGYVYNADKDGPKATPLKVSMLELGFTPNFYQFVDTIIEVKISISVMQQTEQSRVDSSSQRTNLGYWWASGIYASTSQVNAAYSSKYGYSVEGSSLLRTKLVPIPAPAILEDRIREVMRIERNYEQWKLLQGMLNQAKAELQAASSEDRPAKQEVVDRLNAQLLTLLENFGTPS